MVAPPAILATILNLFTLYFSSNVIISSGMPLFAYLFCSCLRYLISGALYGESPPILSRGEYIAIPTQEPSIVFRTSGQADTESSPTPTFIVFIAPSIPADLQG